MNCDAYTNLDLHQLTCPNCEIMALTIPVGEALDKIHKLLDAQHELQQAMAKTMIKFNEDLEKLEKRIFPPEDTPRIRKGKMLN